MIDKNRREFIITISRYAIGSLLLGGAFALLARRENKSCIAKVPYCKNCKVLRNCNLPEALSYKNFEKES